MLCRLSSSESVLGNTSASGMPTSASVLVPTSAERDLAIHDVCSCRSKNRNTREKSHPSPLSQKANKDCVITSIWLSPLKEKGFSTTIKSTSNEDGHEAESLFWKTLEDKCFLNPQIICKLYCRGNYYSDYFLYSATREQGSFRPLPLGEEESHHHHHVLLPHE